MPPRDARWDQFSILLPVEGRQQCHRWKRTEHGERNSTMTCVSEALDFKALSLNPAVSCRKAGNLHFKGLKSHWDHTEHFSLMPLEGVEER